MKVDGEAGEGSRRARGQPPDRNTRPAATGTIEIQAARLTPSPPADPPPANSAGHSKRWTAPA